MCVYVCDHKCESDGSFVVSEQKVTIKIFRFWTFFYFEKDPPLIFLLFSLPGQPPRGLSFIGRACTALEATYSSAAYDYELTSRLYFSGGKAQQKVSSFQSNFENWIELKGNSLSFFKKKKIMFF